MHLKSALCDILRQWVRDIKDHTNKQ